MRIEGRGWADGMGDDNLYYELCYLLIHYIHLMIVGMLVYMIQLFVIYTLLLSVSRLSYVPS